MPYLTKALVTAQCLCVATKKVYTVSGCVSTVIECKYPLLRKWYEEKKIVHPQFLLLDNRRKLYTHANGYFNENNQKIFLQAIDRYSVIPILTIAEAVLISTAIEKVKKNPRAEELYLKELNKNLISYRRLLKKHARKDPNFARKQRVREKQLSKVPS